MLTVVHLVLLYTPTLAQSSVSEDEKYNKKEGNWLILVGSMATRQPSPSHRTAIEPVGGPDDKLYQVQEAE